MAYSFQRFSVYFIRETLIKWRIHFQAISNRYSSSNDVFVFKSFRLFDKGLKWRIQLQEYQVYLDPRIGFENFDLIFNRIYNSVTIARTLLSPILSLIFLSKAFVLLKSEAFRFLLSALFDEFLSSTVSSNSHWEWFRLEKFDVNVMLSRFFCNL